MSKLRLKKTKGKDEADQWLAQHADDPAFRELVPLPRSSQDPDRVDASDARPPRWRRPDLPRGLDVEDIDPMGRRHASLLSLAEGPEELDEAHRAAAARLAVIFAGAAKLGTATPRARRATQQAARALWGGIEHAWIGAFRARLETSYLLRVEAAQNGDPPPKEASAKAIVEGLCADLAAPKWAPVSVAKPPWVTPTLVRWLLARVTLARGGGSTRKLSISVIENLLREPPRLAAEIERDARRIAKHDEVDARRLKALAAKIRNSSI